MASKQKKRDKYSLADLKILGQKLLTSRLHINNLPILLTFVTPNSPPQHALESLLSLQSFFTPLLPLLPASNPSHESNPDPEFVYRVWLRSKFDDFVQNLCDVFVSSKSDDAFREVALDAVMEFVKMRSAGKFHSAIYHKLLHSIVHSMLGIDDSLLDLLTTKYFNFVDVCYFTYISLDKIARTMEEKGDKTVENQSHVTSSMDLSIYKIHYFLSHIPPLEASGEKLDLEAWTDLGIFIGRSNSKENTTREDSNSLSRKPNHKLLPSRTVSKKMKLKFTKAWIAFLRLPIPLDVYKEVLVTLHEAVIPYLTSPIMLCDFLTRSYDIGGVISVMALSSLYILMTQHGIEYPNFYDKLYALLEPSIFMAKHRSKFFQLLDSCLKSSLLPAYLAAAFCKKLSRLALCVPPAGALVIVALVHNLLERHPSINCLFHWEGGTGTGRGNYEEENESMKNAEKCSDIQVLFDRKGGFDHFKNEESDPKDTNAMRSSLWEIDNLRYHYCPPVSRFVLSLENDLAVRARAPEIAIKDFSSGSYATIFNNEMRRRVKQVPLAFYKTTPSSLFSEFDFPGWTFKFKDAESIPMNDNDQAIIISEDHSDKSAKRMRTN
ncbi:protein NUCLEOLAR COMPLEX ASSOCIATED 4 [Primulina huaijiensis]|uniref:protein NUCLEOLAR COMPLEX ASSOCIATED 4 n=1 Tax=Primulina huaijiensis TaxID=1492673 RepID=UPI003CC78100